MAKPKHRRCATCGVVTSRYARTERQGSFGIAVWTRDAVNGEQVDQGTGKRSCDAHALQSPVPPVPALPLPPVTVDDLLRRAAADERLDDDTFAVLAPALRSVDPVNGDGAL